MRSYFPRRRPSLARARSTISAWIAACSPEFCSSEATRCAFSPDTIATRVASLGLLRKAIPRPSASSSGNTNTQKTTSGSRLSSSIRAMSKCVYPDQRPFRFGGRPRGRLVVVTGVSCATLIEDCLQLLRLPLIQEFEQGLWRRRPRVLKLAVLLTHNQFPIALQNRQRGNAFIERHLKLLRQVRVFFPVGANIHVHDLVTRHHGAELRTVKCQVEDMAVVTPVCSKYQEHAFMFFGGLRFCFFDFGTRIGARGVEILVFLENLFQVQGIGSLHRRQSRSVLLLLPHLFHFHVNFCLLRLLC